LGEEKRIEEYFEGLEDPRRNFLTRHKLNDMIVLAICGVICGAEGWTDIEEFGQSKEEWLRQYLELPHGIPSHDTFGRLFAVIDPESFQRCFIDWVKHLAKITKGEVVAIDGKTARRSYSNEDNKAAIHMVSAWANTNKLVLGQVKVDDKSNEITAIPRLLELLDITGSIITIDAMGCQKDIAAKIVDKEADYVLAVKGNQGRLLEEVEYYLQEGKRTQFEGMNVDFFESIEKDHGRIETRRCWVTQDIDWLESKKDWKGLQSVAMIEAIRETGKKVSQDVRFYIGSLDCGAKQFLNIIRGHWGIENELHWVLDVSFREDDCRVRKDNSPQNLAVLRHIALNLLKKETSVKKGLRAKRLKAGWDTKYLMKVLTN